MPDQITVTAKVGPAQTVTTLAIPNVMEFRVDTIVGMLYVRTSDKSGVIQEFDIGAITTFTVTVSSNLYTITIS